MEPYGLFPCRGKGSETGVGVSLSLWHPHSFLSTTRWGPLGQGPALPTRVYVVPSTGVGQWCALKGCDHLNTAYPPLGELGIGIAGNMGVQVSLVLPLTCYG